MWYYNPSQAFLEGEEFFQIFRLGHGAMSIIIKISTFSGIRFYALFGSKLQRRLPDPNKPQRLPCTFRF
jgi:hypothetical protein